MQNQKPIERQGVKEDSQTTTAEVCPLCGTAVNREVLGEHVCTNPNQETSQASIGSIEVSGSNPVDDNNLREKINPVPGTGKPSFDSK